MLEAQLLVPGHRECQAGAGSQLPGGLLRLLPRFRQGRKHLQQACSGSVSRLSSGGSPLGLTACSLG